MVVPLSSTLLQDEDDIPSSALSNPGSETRSFLASEEETRHFHMNNELSGDP